MHTAPAKNRRIALVLGGGGMKGFAHIGVMTALEERGIVPTLYAGTSIGAMLAAARVGGMSPAELARRSTTLRRRDIFRINHFGMLMDRMRSPSIYLEDPLRDLTRAVVPPGKFSDLDTPLLVNTVDIERGQPVIWGSPGLKDVYIHDAVYASCALPGYFPPGLVDGRLCIDGGVVDNLPVAIASLDADLVIAVDVGSTDLRPIHDALALGFANIYMRAATTMMHALQQYPLTHWGGPPMVLIRPRCGDDRRGTSRRAQGARRHRRVLRSTRRRVSSPSLRARSRAGQVHRLRPLRLDGAEPHGPGFRGEGLYADANRGMVAGRRRFRPGVPHERDHCPKDRSHRSAQGRGAGSRLISSTSVIRVPSQM
jgi:predicted acylesterase/phospholipase RssA